MAILSRTEIQKRMKLGVSNPRSLNITPMLRKNEAFDVDSLDLRLGCYFLLQKGSQQPYFAPDKESSRSLQTSVHVPLGKYLVVPAHQTVLGATLEFIKFPYDVSGQILTKSSVARTFIVIETAPWIHPSYRGCLTLEIANVSNTPVLLYPGRTIGQLILMEVKSPSRETQLESTYFGPIYPEAPHFRNPVEELSDIGIDQVLVIPQPKFVSGTKT
jgi:dCTP deaminase